jgi:uncharacterized protein HemY
MRDSYKRRPQDFKRRVIEYVERREDLYDAENKWLSMIKEEEVKVRYYNLNLVANHWTAYPENVKSISEKISHRTKEAMQRPDVRANYEKGLKERDNKGSDPEVVEKRKQTMIKTLDAKFELDLEKIQSDLNDDKSLREVAKLHNTSFARLKRLVSEGLLEYDMSKSYIKGGKKMWESRSEEQRKEIGSKISEGLVGRQNRLGQTNSTEHRKRISESLKGKVHPRYRISIDGVEYKSTTEASLCLGISVATIGRRLNSDKYDKYFRL